MSRGHKHTSATAHAPHGAVTVGCIVAWVRCDACGETVACAADQTADGDEVRGELATDLGWTEDETGRDLCPACAPQEVRR